MKKFLIVLILSACLSACSVSGGVNISNGGANLGIGSGIHF